MLDKGRAEENEEKRSSLKEMNRARHPSRQRKDWTCEDARQAAVHFKVISSRGQRLNNRGTISTVAS